MTKLKLEIYWGFYLAFTFIVWMQVERWLGFHTDKIIFQPIFSSLLFIPLTFLYWRALFLKKQNDYKNTITFQQSFISSLLITGVFALFLPIALYFSLKYISPDLLQNFIAKTMQSGKISLAEAQSYYNFKSLLLMNYSTLLPIGIIIGYVISKKNATKK
ncbi:DUF4199 domain-containing protein [Flavobacterium sp. 20NA77.7]|uniref:DUF4199 domain-containing protein n=1 Tax=Flavobacterium nakdongensis TaxID=3073563 RepID=A0ABY9R6K6_9FLAO|nr:DUF4199 domain-containing protein [Flavobacterium sp. 20NA77.7]WMW76913.1 DUF4199 domain-containing protein [Flavobacterium sp. 20NA77.7]